MTISCSHRKVARHGVFSESVLSLGVGSQASKKYHRLMDVAILIVASASLLLGAVAFIWQVHRARQTVKVELLDQGENVKINVRNYTGLPHIVSSPQFYCRKGELTIIGVTGSLPCGLPDRHVAEAAAKRADILRSMLNILGLKKVVPFWVQVQVDGDRTVKSAKLHLGS